MARQIRKKSGTGIYHVMLRGINRQDIFEDNEDYLQMTSIFYAYCLMSNHLHLLIQEREDNISDIVKRIGVTYAHYFNKKYERNGHLFQDRFRSEPVDDIGLIKRRQVYRGVANEFFLWCDQKKHEIIWK